MRKAHSSKSLWSNKGDTHTNKWLKGNKKRLMGGHERELLNLRGPLTAVKCSIKLHGVYSPKIFESNLKRYLRKGHLYILSLSTHPFPI